jgi:hypothetical protein
MENAAIFVLVKCKLLGVAGGEIHGNHRRATSIFLCAGVLMKQ